MGERALSSVAAAYERFRPGYPVRLFDLVMGYANADIVVHLARRRDGG